MPSDGWWDEVVKTACGMKNLSCCKIQGGVVGWVNVVPSTEYWVGSF
jgi:hypothetical protein